MFSQRKRKFLVAVRKRAKFFPNPLYLKAAPRFFYKSGVANLAVKLLRRTYLTFFWGLFKNNHSKATRLPLPYWWRLFHLRFQESAALIRFVPHFIRKRTKRIPFGARSLLKRKQLFRSFAAIVRRSRQNSVKALINELQLIFNRSITSKLINFRDSQHKKAESSKPLVRRGRLPHIPNFFSQFYDAQPKRFMIRMRKDKIFKKKIRLLAKQKLKIARIEAFYARKSSSFAARRVRVRLQRIRFNLFFNPNWRLRFRTILLNLFQDES